MFTVILSQSWLFDEPGRSLGQKQMPLEAQDGFPENVVYHRAEVTFVAANVPGSNNGLQPWSGLGNTAANIAGQVATQAIVTATSMSSNVKSKDEITLDLRVNKIGSADVLTQQFKAKAKSNGDDIISQIVEQAAQAIVNALGSN